MSPLSILSPRRLREAVVVTLGGLAGIAVDSAEVAESGSTLRAIETRGALLCGVDGGLAADGGDGFGEGDLFGADLDAVLCVTAVRYAAGAH